MDKDELTRLLKHLDLPAGEYVVFGGSTLAIRDLRDAKDIDLFVTNGLYDILLSKGWRKSSNKVDVNPYLITKMSNIEIQAYKNWDYSGWQPKIQSYLINPEIIEGIPFMPLKDMYEWKVFTARGKDIRDAKLIAGFLSKQK